MFSTPQVKINEYKNKIHPLEAWKFVKFESINSLIDFIFEKLYKHNFSVMLSGLKHRIASSLKLSVGKVTVKDSPSDAC